MTIYRLRRNMLNRVFGGVCGGFASYLGINAWWVRFAFITLTITSSAFGVLLYLLLWAMIPAQGVADVLPIVRPGGQRPLRYPQPEGVLIIGTLSIVVGVIVLMKTTGVLQGVGGDLLAPGMLLLLGIVVLFKHLRGAA
jgi:phage shock protein PspC (stress-responsive transcriptional regulator)